MSDYQTLLQQSTDNPNSFWREQARRIDWQRNFSSVLDDSDPPSPKWFCGGLTNLCHNAVDRHLRDREDQPALIFVSTETNSERTLTYRQLHREVNIMASVLLNMGVRQGDRVLIYLPMIAEAAIAMLACARIGAIHSVVFGGFAAASLAVRIDDAQPALVICADAGFQSGQLINYKQLMDAALDKAVHAPSRLLLIDRDLSPCDMKPERDFRYDIERVRELDAEVPCTWLPSEAPSYILYTSGTTGKPKGVQRDTGGHAVSLATSMELLFQAKPGNVMFTTSDLGWVVGHSYGLYGPLLAGMTSVLMEGSPVRPDPGIWWRLVKTYQVNLMLSSATAMRLLKRHGFGQPDTEPTRLASLRALFLAGEPLDEATAHSIEKALGVPVVDHYWQTETGSPMIGLPPTGHQRGADDKLPVTALPRRHGSPGLAAAGYRLAVVDEETGIPCPMGKKGLLVAEGVLPPGCLTTLWGKDADYRRIYWSLQDGAWRYSTFDWAVADKDGYIYLLGRADDVINAAGKRIGTREIEEILLEDEAVAEVAVVGTSHILRGQVPVAFVVLHRHAMQNDSKAVERRLIDAVDNSLGTLARPKRILFVNSLPRTRSGKILRRVIQDVIAAKSIQDLDAPDLQLIITDLSSAFHAKEKQQLMLEESSP
ncbi:propionate--CoA ligase [Collimonas silvisoli]|uniref:propionate--CoA ligase n=1 Tax=Collimonas silvisoli TaxID=2825884 RepID=UPI001B8BE04B|nr:propionate--CoA ligase [Collimonas silvisoli]